MAKAKRTCEEVQADIDKQEAKRRAEYLRQKKENDEKREVVRAAIAAAGETKNVPPPWESVPFPAKAIAQVHRVKMQMFASLKNKLQGYLKGVADTLGVPEDSISDIEEMVFRPPNEKDAARAPRPADTGEGKEKQE